MLYLLVLALIGFQQPDKSDFSLVGPAPPIQKAKDESVQKSIEEIRKNRAKQEAARKLAEKPPQKPAVITPVKGWHLGTVNGQSVWLWGWVGYNGVVYYQPAEQPLQQIQTQEPVVPMQPSPQRRIRFRR